MARKKKSNEPKKRTKKKSPEVWHGSDSDTLGKTKGWTDNNAPKSNGCFCPCCGQYAKDGPVRFIKSFALTLLGMYRWFKLHPDQEWMKVEDDLKVLCGSDFNRYHGKLVHWGLVEKQPAGEYVTDNPHTGFWKLTQLGVKVASIAGYKLAAKIYLRRGVAVANSRDQVTIPQALGKSFDPSQDVYGVYPPWLKSCKKPKK